MAYRKVEVGEDGVAIDPQHSSLVPGPHVQELPENTDLGPSAVTLPSMAVPAHDLQAVAVA